MLKTLVLTVTSMNITVFCLVETDVSDVLTFACFREMMEVVSTSETSIDFYETTWCNIPEDSHLHVSYTSPQHKNMLRFSHDYDYYHVIYNQDLYSSYVCVRRRHIKARSSASLCSEAVNWTGRRDGVLRTPTSYSGGPGFKHSAWRPAIVTEDFSGFPQSLQVNAGTVPKIHGRFLPHPFQFIIHPSIRGDIFWVMEEASLNKLQTVVDYSKYVNTLLRN
jgi:hypothetical protein